MSCISRFDGIQVSIISGNICVNALQLSFPCAWGLFSVELLVFSCSTLRNSHVFFPHKIFHYLGFELGNNSVFRNYILTPIYDTKKT